MKKHARLENDIQRDIELAIGAEPDLLILRNSVGQAVYVDEDTERRYVVPYGLGTGSPDLVCQLHVWGVAVWLCLEVKAPGEVPRPDQEKCHVQWRRFGALVAVVTSADEGIEAVVQARKEVRRRIKKEMVAS